MNANIVTINGKVIQPIKSSKHYFTVIIKCGDEEICVHIPKKMYRILPDPVKKALTRNNEYVLIEGFIDNGDRSASDISSQYRIIADNVYRGRPDEVNIVLASGIVCDMQKRIDRDYISLGILEGRRMTVISGDLIHDGNGHEIHIFDTVKLTGRIKGQKIYFTGLREV